MKKNWVEFPQKTDLEWIGEYLMTQIAWAFRKKHKRWPKTFNPKSVKLKGRMLTLNME